MSAPAFRSVPLPHEIVTVVGRTGSGKTQLIAKLIGPRHPRRITLDLVGECATLYPSATKVQSLPDVVRTLRAWHDANVNRWHLVAALTHDEIADLLQLMAPLQGGAPYSLAAAWGGITLEIFELDMIAPVTRIGKRLPVAITNAYARGRHYGLSILGATQRPHQVDRMATAQSSVVITFGMHEPHDIAWLERIGGRRFGEVARQGLRDYESVWYFARTGDMWTLDKAYRQWQAVPRDNARTDDRRDSDRHPPRPL
jgi:hypothetical protein